MKNINKNIADLNKEMKKHSKIANQICNMGGHTTEGQLVVFANEFRQFEGSLLELKDSCRTGKMSDVKKIISALNQNFKDLIQSMEDGDEYEFDAKDINKIKAVFKNLNESIKNSKTKDRS